MTSAIVVQRCILHACNYSQELISATKRCIFTALISSCYSYCLNFETVYYVIVYMIIQTHIWFAQQEKLNGIVYTCMLFDNSCLGPGICIFTLMLCITTQLRGLYLNINRSCASLSNNYITQCALLLHLQFWKCYHSAPVGMVQMPLKGWCTVYLEKITSLCFNMYL